MQRYLTKYMYFNGSFSMQYRRNSRAESETCPQAFSFAFSYKFQPLHLLFCSSFVSEGYFFIMGTFLKVE